MAGLELGELAGGHVGRLDHEAFLSHVVDTDLATAAGRGLGNVDCRCLAGACWNRQGQGDRRRQKAREKASTVDGNHHYLMSIE